MMAIPVLEYTVYAHKNKTNGKLYIGVTKQNPSKRFQNGFGYKYSNPALWEDIVKYGWDNFEHLILLSRVSKDIASIFEKELIEKYRTTNHYFGYNQQEGGFRPTRPEISKMMKKRVGPLNPNYGKKAPENTRNALLKRAREGQFGSDNAMAKPVRMYGKNGQYIRSFNCIVDAEKFLHVNSSHIVDCCKGRRKSSNGFIWKYERSDDLSRYQY